MEASIWMVSVIQRLMMDDKVKEELQSVKGKLEKEVEKTNQISLKLFISLMEQELLLDCYWKKPRPVLIKIA